MSEVRVEVERVLRMIGMSGTKKGFWGFYWSVIFALEDPTVLYMVTKDLYPLVAETCCMTQTNLERDMRLLLEWCWNYGDRDTLQKIAGRRLMVKPSVGELVDHLAGYLRYQGY